MRNFEKMKFWVFKSSSCINEYYNVPTMDMIKLFQVYFRDILKRLEIYDKNNLIVQQIANFVAC